MDKLRPWEIRSLECFCSEIQPPSGEGVKPQVPARGQPGVRECPKRAKKGGGTGAYFVFSIAARPIIQWLLALPAWSLSGTHAIAPNLCSIPPVHKTSRPHHRHSQLRPGS